MSRIGKKPVPMPEGVEVVIVEGEIEVKGPKGSLKQAIPPEVAVKVEDGEIIVTSDSDSRRSRAFQGLCRALIDNMVVGVSKGIEKSLEINGLGYRADVEGSELVLNIGYSNPVRFGLPDGITASVEKNTLITIQGIDKQLVGQVAADIRNLRKPEPYKGKGIKYVGEKIRRKAGKTGA
jgi:large subunit ribosomal protein L6